MFFIYFSGNISQVLIVSVRDLHAIYRIYTTRDSTVFNVNDNVEFMMSYNILILIITLISCIVINFG